MAISEKEHFDALRAADQRAIELLAAANAARISQGMLALSNIIAFLAVIVAIFALAWKHT